MKIEVNGRLKSKKVVMVCDIGNMKKVEIVINEKVSLITMYDKVPRKLKTRHFVDVKLDR